MPYEGASPSRPREDLLGAYHEFDPAANGYVAHEAAPMIAVGMENLIYGVVPREAWLARVNTKRAIGAQASESSWKPEARSLELVEYAHKELVDDRMARIYGGWFNAEEIAAMRVAEIINRDAEFDAAALFFNETTFPAENNTGETISGGAEWSAAAGLPLTNIKRAMEKIEEGYGVQANAIIVGSKGLRDAGMTDQVRARITDLFGRVKPNEIGLDAWRQMTGLPKIIVPGGFYNSANPGATPTVGRIWSAEYAWVGRIEDGRDLKRPQSFRTFALDGETDPEITSWPVPDPDGNYVRAKKNIKMQAVGDAPIGYLIKNIAG